MRTGQVVHFGLLQALSVKVPYDLDSGSFQAQAEMAFCHFLGRKIEHLLSFRLLNKNKDWKDRQTKPEMKKVLNFANQSRFCRGFMMVFQGPTLPEFYLTCAQYLFKTAGMKTDLINVTSY